MNSKLVAWIEREAPELGCSIYGFQDFADLGFTCDELCELRDIHQAQDIPSLTNAAGRPVKSVQGLDGCEFIAWLARNIKADTSAVCAVGNKRRARQYAAAVLNKLTGSNLQIADA